MFTWPTSLKYPESKPSTPLTPLKYPESTESEKPCQCVSNADRKVFANPESFCDMLIIG